jgi:hypothetical protein
VRNDWQSIQATEKFLANRWDGADREHKNGVLQVLGKHMDTLDTILAKKDEQAYTAAQLDLQPDPHNNAAFDETLNTLPALFARMVQAEDPLLVGFSSQQLGVQFLPLLQHNGVTSVPVGYTTSNPNNGPGEPESRKLVWAALDRTGGIAIRSWRGRRVPLGLVAWMLGVSPSTLSTQLKARREACEVR